MPPLPPPPIVRIVATSPNPRAVPQAGISPEAHQLWVDAFARFDRRLHHAESIGDAAHNARVSCHSPRNGAGQLMPSKAVDIFPASPGSLVTGYSLVEWLLLPSSRLRYRVGLIIWRRNVWSAAGGWKARPYHGADPHESHVHVSVGGCV